LYVSPDEIKGEFLPPVKWHLSVCNTITFKSLNNNIDSLHLQGIWVKFIYDDYQVKVKVTETKKHKIPIPARKIPIGSNSGSIKDRAIM